MFDDDKELIRSRHMKRARHYNCKKKMDNMTMIQETLNPDHGQVYSIQLNVIKFVSDLRHVGGVLPVLLFPLPIKLTARHMKRARHYNCKKKMDKMTMIQETLHKN
jgi:hypothetical protein